MKIFCLYMFWLLQVLSLVASLSLPHDPAYWNLQLEASISSSGFLIAYAILRSQR
jgi:hypothetical protein